MTVLQAARQVMAFDRRGGGGGESDPTEADVRGRVRHLPGRRCPWLRRRQTALRRLGEPGCVDAVVPSVSPLCPKRVADARSALLHGPRRRDRREGWLALVPGTG